MGWRTPARPDPDHRGHLVDRQTGHFILHFDAAWQPLAPHVSYGHDIEGSWLLVEAAAVLGDEALLAEARTVAVQMAAATLAEGIDTDGGLYNEGANGKIGDPPERMVAPGRGGGGLSECLSADPRGTLPGGGRAILGVHPRCIVDSQHGESYGASRKTAGPATFRRPGRGRAPITMVAPAWKSCAG